MSTAGIAAGKKTPLDALKEENALLKETIADAEASVQEMTGELEVAGVDPSSKAPLVASAEPETPYGKNVRPEVAVPFTSGCVRFQKGARGRSPPPRLER